MNKGIIYLCASIILSFYPSEAAWGSGDADKDVEARRFLSGLSENSIFKREIIVGGTWSDEKGEIGGRNSVGFEFLKTFSNARGDWGNLLIQTRFVRYDRQYMLMNGMRMPPSHVDGTSDFEFEFHDAYFKYSGPFKGKFNVRIGHFDVPFGLEQNVDTHSSLIQLASMRNVGFKKDWGVAIGGKLAEADYEFALTRGTGVEYLERGENYLVSGRIGTPADRNFCIGLSGLHGEVIDGMAVMRGNRMAMMGMPARWFGSTRKPGGDIIRRSRVGLDCIYLLGPYTLKGEVAYGRDENQDVTNSILEIDYLFPDMDGRLEAIGQIQNLRQDITAPGSKEDTFMTVGFNYRLTREITLQTMYRRDFQRIKNTENDNVIGAQLYCYF